MTKCAHHCIFVYLILCLCLNYLGPILEQLLYHLDVTVTAGEMKSCLTLVVLCSKVPA